MRLADYVADFLVAHGVTHCFSVVGGGAMYLNDSLGHKDGLKVVYQHHEQACAIAAEAYARLENRIAALCVTTGPGGTNALTGVLGGWLDSIPMFVISGQVRYDTTARYGERFTDGHPLRAVGDQEFDITKAAQAMTKYAVMIEDPQTIRYHLERAWHLAATGRPGPVWLDIPVNFQGADIRPETLKFSCDIPEVAEWVYGYDPRVVEIDGRYYVTWCNGYHGPTIGVAWTDDFETFHQVENAFLPYNRNGVMFPKKIGGRFAMLSRPSDTGHTAFGDIFYSESPDLEFWGHHRHVMAPAPFEVSAWQCMKIGAGPVPIETSEGWLLLYHGVLRSCNGYVYAFGSALLDLEQPWKVIARSGQYLISPREYYELVGDVPSVTFPCAALHDPETGRIAVYYGCADTVTGLAFGYIPEIVEFTQRTNIL